MTAQRSNAWTGSSAWSGWVVFSSIMLMIIGVVNVLEGIIALIYRNRTVVVSNQLYVVNVTGWGLTLIVFGGVLVFVGTGLLTMRTWARVTAIVLVAIHAIIQIGWLSAYPLWSLLMLALDVVVLYALTAKWSEARSTRTGEFTPSPTDAGATTREGAHSGGWRR